MAVWHNYAIFTYLIRASLDFCYRGNETLLNLY